MSKAFIITMSRGEKLKIDDDEMPKIVEAMQKGTPCRIRQGLFNPSFYISVAEDTGRMKDFRREVQQVKQHNDHDRNYNDGKHQKSKPEFKKLTDIFEGVKLQIEGGDTKKLN